MDQGGKQRKSKLSLAFAHWLNLATTGVAAPIIGVHVTIPNAAHADYAVGIGPLLATSCRFYWGDSQAG